MATWGFFREEGRVKWVGMAEPILAHSHVKFKHDQTFIYWYFIRDTQKNRRCHFCFLILYFQFTLEAQISACFVFLSKNYIFPKERFSKINLLFFFGFVYFSRIPYYVKLWIFFVIFFLLSFKNGPKGMSFQHWTLNF